MKTAHEFITEKEFEYHKLWANWNYEQRAEALQEYADQQLILHGVSNSLPHFDCGMRVKTFDREDGEWVKGEVYGNHNNKVTVKWDDLSEPVEHEQDEWSRFVRL